jgi:hypothetical protein
LYLKAKRKPPGISNKLKKKEKEVEVTSDEENMFKGEAKPPRPFGFVFCLARYCCGICPYFYFMNTLLLSSRFYLYDNLNFYCSASKPLNSLHVISEHTVEQWIKQT